LVGDSTMTKVDMTPSSDSSELGQMQERKSLLRAVNSPLVLCYLATLI